MLIVLDVMMPPGIIVRADESLETPKPRTCVDRNRDQSWSYR